MGTRQTQTLMPRKNYLFLVKVRKNRVGRSVENFFDYFWGQKCVFYVDWELEGRKNFRVGILLN